MDQEVNSTPAEMEAVPVTLPTPDLSDGQAVSGFGDGDKLPDGTTIRYDHDKDGNYIGWHKEPAPSDEVQI